MVATFPKKPEQGGASDPLSAAPFSCGVSGILLWCWGVVASGSDGLSVLLVESSGVFADFAEEAFLRVVAWSQHPQFPAHGYNFCDDRDWRNAVCKLNRIALSDRLVIIIEESRTSRRIRPAGLGCFNFLLGTHWLASWVVFVAGRMASALCKKRRCQSSRLM